MDIASSIQKVLEDIVILMCKFLKNKFDKENLCLAGGVALNCVANGKILKEKIFKNIWIQPQLEMQETLGASLAYYHLELSGPREI